MKLKNAKVYEIDITFSLFFTFHLLPFHLLSFCFSLSPAFHCLYMYRRKYVHTSNAAANTGDNM